MFPRDQDEQRRVMYQAQLRTNELLEQLVSLLTPIKKNEYDNMKRSELMKEIAKLENNPQGWNTWKTDKMREYLKGGSE